jgi:serine/threonine-protein kinase
VVGGAGTQAGAPPYPPRGGAAAAGPALASRVKEIFRTRCYACHGGSKTNAGIKALDRDLLVQKKKKVVPGRPDDSELFQLLTADDDSAMPPPGQPRLPAEEIDAVRRWIVAGAPAFPADVAPPPEKDKEDAFKDVVGVDYVLKTILAHVRDADPDDRPFVRYFSLNHLLAAGVTGPELDLHRDALAKAVNHLSWEPEVVRPRAIDKAASVFAVDIRKLGWQRKPFTRWRDGKAAGAAPLDLFDLVLLEYPYGVFYEDSRTFDNLVREFLIPSGQVRPVPYVRADWFVSVATQPPVYEDLLQLPFDLKELEAKLDVNAEANLTDAVARRAGMSVSGVSHNNRVVERHPARYGAYWKSYDFRSGRGRDNIFKDPINLLPAGGEVIFGLPNGLQGYMLANGQGARVDFAPTDIVTDRFAEDKVVRNGLACMRCHDAGMKGFADAVEPALARLPGSPGFDKRQAQRLYPRQSEMDALLQKDADRFGAALRAALGKPQTREPLAPVSQRFLDAPLHLATAASELGLAGTVGLEQVFKARNFVGLGLVPLSSEGVVRRDMWDDYYDQVVRQLGLGVPVVPLDGLTRRDVQPGRGPEVLLSTNRRGNVFEPGDKAEILVENKSEKDVTIELIGSSTRGVKTVLVQRQVVRAGQTYRCGPLTVRAAVGREQITLFASDRPYTPGELLRGAGLTDRVVHRFYELARDGRRTVSQDGAERVVKKTIEIETR